PRGGLRSAPVSFPTRRSSDLTDYREVLAGCVRAGEWSPVDFGLPPCTLAELKADGPVDSARIIREVLAGRPGAPRRVVVANAAIDRKSTRLNSSHQIISYAVF